MPPSSLRYCVNEVTLDGATLADDVALLAELGVPAMGVQLHKLRTIGVAEGAARLADAGVTAALVSTRPLVLTDRSRWPDEIDEFRRALDDTAAVGAGCLQFHTGSRGQLSYDEAEALFLELLDDLLPEAAARSIVIAPENNHALRVDLGFVHTLHDALDLADAVDSPWFKVCAEVNNAWIERHLYDDLAHRHQRIALLQLSDFVAGTLSTPERVALGDGNIPLERIVTAAVDAGYEGWFDVEIVGTQVYELGSRAVVERSLAWLERFTGSR